MHIIGTPNLPATVAADSSALYARNLLDFLKLVFDKDGQFVVNRDDDIVAACLMCMNGEIVRILRDTGTYERFAPIGMTPRPMRPEEFDQVIRDDVALFTRIAREANIKAE